MSGKDSYIAAYDTKCGDNTAYVEANRLLNREDIQKRVSELRKPLEEQAVNVAISERERKRAVLWDIIANGDNNDKCRALDILNKMDAEYINVNVNKNESPVTLDNIDLKTLKTLTDGI